MVEREALPILRAGQRLTLTVCMQLKGSDSVTVTCADGERVVGNTTTAVGQKI